MPDQKIKILSVIYVILTASCIMAERHKPLNVSYFKDFDKINVTGIGPVSQDSLSLPYVEVLKSRDNSVKVKFHLANKEIYKKNYWYENGVLTSTIRYRLHDGGCRGFKVYEFYFEKDKMISYSFCDYAAFSNHKQIFYINTEMWLNNRLDHISKTLYPNTSEGYSDLPDIFFDYSKDFNGRIFNKGKVVDEVMLRQDGDSVLLESKGYSYHEKDTRPVVSIWRWLELSNGIF